MATQPSLTQPHPQTYPSPYADVGHLATANRNSLALSLLSSSVDPPLTYRQGARYAEHSPHLSSS